MSDKSVQVCIRLSPATVTTITGFCRKNQFGQIIKGEYQRVVTLLIQKYAGEANGLEFLELEEAE